jgi:hypothetical protein
MVLSHDADAIISLFVENAQVLIGFVCPRNFFSTSAFVASQRMIEQSQEAERRRFESLAHAQALTRFS